jgi:hypothetical protein
MTLRQIKQSFAKIFRSKSLVASEADDEPKLLSLPKALSEDRVSGDGGDRRSCSDVAAVCLEDCHNSKTGDNDKGSLSSGDSGV